MDTVKPQGQAFPTGILFNVNGERVKAKVACGYVCEYTEQVGVLRKYVAFIKAHHRLIMSRQYTQSFHFTLSGRHLRVWLTDGSAIITHQIKHATFTHDCLTDYASEDTITWHINAYAVDQIIKGLKPKDVITIRVTDDNELIINNIIVKNVEEIKHPKIPPMFLDYKAKDVVRTDNYDINLDYVNEYADVVSAFVNEKVQLKDMMIAKHIDNNKKIRFIRHDNSEKVLDHGLLLLVMPRVLPYGGSKADVALK